MKTRKTFLLLLFAAIFTVSALCFSSCNKKTQEGSGAGIEDAPSSSKYLEFRLSEEKTYYIVVAKTGAAPTEIVIPEKHRKKPVTHIPENAFVNLTELTSVTIPESVTDIGGSAFKNCVSLKNVYIPSSVTSIGSGAFSGCSSLESITIPFVGAKADITENSSNSYQYPLGYLFGTSPYEGGVATAQNIYNASANVQSKVTYYIPSTLKSVAVTDDKISLGAFYKCKDLTDVKIGKDVKTINSHAFEECSGLAGIEIPDSVQKIGRSAFYGCSGLKDIVIPDSVTSIGEGAFGGCSGLESMTIPFIGHTKKTSGDTYQYPFGYIFGTSDSGGIGVEQLYYGSSIKSTARSTYRIPASLKTVTVTGGEILYGAFSRCKMLTSINIPKSLKRIEDDAFFACTGITEIDIPDKVEYMGKSAFSGCSSLSIATIPANTKIISEHLFSRCENLTTINIRGGIESIGEDAFYRCSGLTSINFNGTKSQWNAIKKGTSWNSNTGNYTVTCTDGILNKTT